MRKKYIPAHAEKNSKISRKKAIISAIAVALSLCALMTGMFVAKYLNERSSDNLVIAKNFYFTSNLLDGKEHTLAPGSTSVTFTLGNHEDDLRYSEVDIDYTVTVQRVQEATGSGGDTGTNNTGASATGTNDTGIPENGSVQDAAGTPQNASVQNAEGKLTKGSVQDKEVTVSDLQPGTYIITAVGKGGYSTVSEEGDSNVGKGGYSKTLTATIVIPPKETRLYYYIDPSAGEYTLLTVWNEGDIKGDVTISYTGIPDNTNPDMTDWKTGESGKEVTVEPHQSKVFRFFGETNITVTGATFKEPR